MSEILMIHKKGLVKLLNEPRNEFKFTDLQIILSNNDNPLTVMQLKKLLRILIERGIIVSRNNTYYVIKDNLRALLNDLPLLERFW